MSHYLVLFALILVTGALNIAVLVRYPAARSVYSPLRYAGIFSNRK